MLRILGILPAIIPSTVIGVIKPLTELDRRGEIRLRLQLSDSFSFNNFDWCDVVVFCRNCEIIDLNLLYNLKLKGKKIVFELDDNFEEIPLDTYIGLYLRQYYRLHVIRRFYELSDVTRVFSDRLFHQASRHNANLQRVNSYFDFSIVDGLTVRPSNDDVIKLAFPSSRIDNNEIGMDFYEAVTTILSRYPGKVELHLWGNSIPAPLVGLEGVILNKSDKNYRRFVSTFFQSGFDIGLAPGNDNPFFHSKTNNKYREFGGCGIAGIYSNFPPYANSVVHKVTGLLVDSTPSDWIDAIELLISNKQLRTNIQRAAKEDVLNRYSLNSTLESWRETFRMLNKSNRPAPHWIYQSNHRSVFCLVHLNSTDETDEETIRIRSLEFGYRCVGKTCSYITGSEFITFSNLVDYLNSNYQQRATGVFLVSNATHIKELCNVLPLSASTIIDLTRYRTEIESDVLLLRSMAKHLPTSFLLTTKQFQTFSAGSSIADDIFVMSSDCLSPFDEQYSLQGYSAAYLDLFERHVNYSNPTKDMLRVRTRLSFITRRIASRYIRYSSLFMRIIHSLKFRLGFIRY